MCAQCMVTATAAVGTATGLRAWLATRGWLTAVQLRRLTVALLVAAVVVSALGLQGT